MRTNVMWVALSVLLGCAHGGAGRESSGSTDDEILTSESLPPGLRAEVEQAKQLGVMLFRYDRAAAIGTDVLTDKIGPPQNLGLGGYIALPEGTMQSGPSGAWSVLFYTPGDSPKVKYRVRLPVKGEPRVEVKDPPEAPDAVLRKHIQARTTAIGALRDIKQPMNTVVLAGETIGEPGWVVYLLAGTTRSGVVVFGKHYRVLVSEEGERVKRFEPLSRGTLVVRKPPPDAKDGYVVVTHHISNAPMEHHVFASLQHDLMVLVATAKRSWQIEGTRILYVNADAQSEER